MPEIRLSSLAYTLVMRYAARMPAHERKQYLARQGLDIDRVLRDCFDAAVRSEPDQQALLRRLVKVRSQFSQMGWTKKDVRKAAARVGIPTQYHMFLSGPLRLEVADKRRQGKSLEHISRASVSIVTAVNRRS